MILNAFEYARKSSVDETNNNYKKMVFVNDNEFDRELKCKV